MSERLVILNDFDRPEPRMIALVRDGNDGREWTYVSADKRLVRAKGLRWLPARFPDEMTDVSDFGVRPVIELLNGKLVIGVQAVGASVATYQDGAERRWQGHIEARATIRANLLPLLKAWQRAEALAEQSA